MNGNCWKTDGKINQFRHADLLVGLISIPTDIVWQMTYEWYAGNIGCKAVRYSQVRPTRTTTKDRQIKSKPPVITG